MKLNFYPTKKYLSYITLILLTGAVFFTTPQPILAQSTPIKWGKVTDEELKLKICPFDSSAAAVVLCDYGDVSFNYGSYVTINRHIRIKILDRKAIDRANIILSYYVENELEKITDIKAQTININPQGKLSIHEVTS